MTATVSRASSAPAERLAILVGRLHEVLELLRVAVHPVFVRGGMAPPLLRADLLRDVDIPEKLSRGLKVVKASIGFRLHLVRWLLARTSSHELMPPSTSSAAKMSASVPSSKTTCSCE